MKPANPHILTINGGSSSIKSALFKADDLLRQIFTGGIERIGLPEEILLIEAFHSRFPDLPQVACFDTAFHHNLPRVARLLPIMRNG
ncbi:MAG: hypothetical protein GWP06_11490 [Actinobacteria bacterium]|nr:hypothetical protein [Actinomycetota bacterium]